MLGTIVVFSGCFQEMRRKQMQETDTWSFSHGACCLDNKGGTEVISRCHQLPPNSEPDLEPEVSSMGEISEMTCYVSALGQDSHENTSEKSGSFFQE